MAVDVEDNNAAISDGCDMDELEIAHDPAVIDLVKMLRSHENWDVTRFSPVFFGCKIAAPRERGELGGNVASNPLGEPDMHKKLGQKVANTLPVRQYVDQALSSKLDKIVATMLKRLMELQERLRLKDPVRSQMRRRLVFGFREVLRGIRSRRCMCIILAPNTEQGTGAHPGGLDQTVKELIDRCQPTEDEIEQGKEGVPVVFALSKARLGATLGKQIKVSVVGLYNADGAHEEYKQMLRLAGQLRSYWSGVVRHECATGVYPLCSICHDFMPQLRYDCTQCKVTRCSKCAASVVSRNVPCAAHESAGGRGEDGGQVSCDIVKVARTVPAAQAEAAQAASVARKAAAQDAKEEKAARKPGAASKKEGGKANKRKTRAAGAPGAPGAPGAAGAPGAPVQGSDRLLPPRGPGGAGDNANNAVGLSATAREFLPAKVVHLTAAAPEFVPRAPEG